MNAMNQPWPSGWWAQREPMKHLDPVLTLHLHMSKAFCAHARHMLLSCLLLLSWLEIRTLHSDPGYPVACTAKDAFARASITGSFAALLFRGSPIPQNRTIWWPQMYPTSSYASEPPTLISNWGDWVMRSDSCFKRCLSPNRRLSCHFFSLHPSQKAVW